MNRFIPILLVIITLASAPLVSAADAHAPSAPEASAPGTTLLECDNYGVIVSVGSFTCYTECTNYGIVVWVGHSCYSRGAAGACVYPHPCAIVFVGDWS